MHGKHVSHHDLVGRSEDESGRGYCDGAQGERDGTAQKRDTGLLFKFRLKSEHGTTRSWSTLRTRDSTHKFASCAHVRPSPQFMHYSMFCSEGGVIRLVSLMHNKRDQLPVYLDTGGYCSWPGVSWDRQRRDFADHVHSNKLPPWISC